MSHDPKALPELLQEIADVAGREAALAIAAAKGGARAYFPVRAPDGHWLVEAVGRTAADKLCKHFSSLNAGVELRIPLGRATHYGNAKSLVVKLSAEGLSISATARALGVSMRCVEKWMQQAKKAGVDMMGAPVRKDLRNVGARAGHTPMLGARCPTCGAARGHSPER